MSPKKPVSPPSDRGYQKKLEYLNARKSAIDSLIHSLEDYDRFRSRRLEDGKQKIA